MITSISDIKPGYWITVEATPQRLYKVIGTYNNAFLCTYIDETTQATFDALLDNLFETPGYKVFKSLTDYGQEAPEALI